MFDAQLAFKNQLGNLREDIDVKASDLLKIPVKTSGGRVCVITENGIRNNISIGLLYIESWLRGNGCVPLNNLMEDAATAEISRSQLWQWLNHQSAIEDGTSITKDLLDNIFKDENKIKILFFSKTILLLLKK